MHVRGSHDLIFLLSKTEKRLAEEFLYKALGQGCPYIHETRINAMLEVSV